VTSLSCPLLEINFFIIINIFKTRKAPHDSKIAQNLKIVCQGFWSLVHL